MSVTEDLLPPSATSPERAISLAVKRASEVETPLRTLWLESECPEELLPWLAWSLAVEPWDGSWSADQKRAAITAAFPVHARRGTLAAVEIAVNALGYGEAIIAENATAPFTFSVRLECPTAGVGEAQLREVESVAIRAKNARSHLLSIIATQSSTPFTKTRAATITGMTVIVHPQS